MTFTRALIKARTNVSPASAQAYACDSDRNSPAQLELRLACDF